MPGVANSKARSSPPMKTLQTTALTAVARGRATWRLDQLARQRQAVHSAKGQTGHMNQVH